MSFKTSPCLHLHQIRLVVYQLITDQEEKINWYFCTRLSPSVTRQQKSGIIYNEVLNKKMLRKELDVHCT